MMRELNLILDPLKREEDLMISTWPMMTTEKEQASADQKDPDVVGEAEGVISAEEVQGSEGRAETQGPKEDQTLKPPTSLSRSHMKVEDLPVLSADPEDVLQEAKQKTQNRRV